MVLFRGFSLNHFWMNSLLWPALLIFLYHKDGWQQVSNLYRKWKTKGHVKFKFNSQPPWSPKASRCFSQTSALKYRKWARKTPRGTPRRSDTTPPRNSAVKVNTKFKHRPTPTPPMSPPGVQNAVIRRHAKGVAPDLCRRNFYSASTAYVIV